MPATKEELARRRLLIFIIMTVASLLSCFHQVGLSTVSGEIAATFNANPSDLALLASATAYTYAFMQIPVGILVDTLGSRKTVTIALFIAAIGTFIFATTQDLTYAIIGRVLIGLGISAICVPFMKLIAVWFLPQAFGKLVALSFTVASFGLLLATSPMAYATKFIGWQNIYIILAIITLICAFAVFYIVRDSRRGVKWHAGEKDVCMPTFREILGSILTKKEVWYVGLWYFCQGGIYYAFIALWSGQYLVKGLGMTVEESGLVLTLPMCALILSPIVTWISTKMKPSKLLLILSLIAIAFTAPFAFGFAPSSLVGMSAVLFVISITATSCAAVVFAIAKNLFSVKYAGTVSGFINIFPFVGGAIIQQIIGFLLPDNIEGSSNAAHAFEQAFIVLPIFAIFGLIMICLFMRRTKKCFI